MEMQPVAEFPFNRNLDRRPRKRPRLTWDIPPALPPPLPPLPPPTVFPAIYLGQEFANGVVPNYGYLFVFHRAVPHVGSPPWRLDDKDGHFVFVAGESLTSRCN